MSVTGIPKVRMQARGLHHSGNTEAAKSLANLADAYEFLAAEYARVMRQAGYSDSVEASEQLALSWVDPAQRPAVDPE